MKYYFKYLSIFLLTFGLFQMAYAETLEETFKKRISADNVTFLSVYNKNGNIEVEGWGEDEIEIIAYKRVRASDWDRAKELMANLEIEINETGNRVEIETLYPRRSKKGGGFFSWLVHGGGESNASVEYIIKVPHKMDLKLNSTNGGILVNDCNGFIDLHTTNGKIVAEDIKGTLNCNTTNGSIKAYLHEVDPIEDMTFKSTNGSIKLYLPDDTDADLEARTTNGSINCDLPMDSKRSKSKRSLYGEINDGGPLIYMKTTNGSIRIYEI